MLNSLRTMALHVNRTRTRSLEPGPARSPNTTLPFWLACYLILPALTSSPLAATNTASLHLYCQSVRLNPADATSLGLVYHTEFSSYGTFGPPNHELFPPYTDSPVRASSFYLTGDAFSGLGGLTGGLRVDVPDNIDEDADTVPDFFQVDHAVDTTSTGAFQVDDPFDPEALLDYGPVQITWHREAGQHYGSCQLTWVGQGPASTRIIPPSGLSFTHTFEILEYAGDLRYQPAPQEIRSDTTLAQKGNPDFTLHGPLPITRIPTDPPDSCRFLESSLTNAANDTLIVVEGYLEIGNLPSTYQGALYFDDGDLTTPDEPDYEFYLVRVKDPNDSDQDDTPDLTDPPESEPLQLSIEQTNSNLVLTVTASAGQSLIVQTATDLRSPNWQEFTTVTLTNSTLHIPVPNLGGPAAFWRLFVKP